jgi:hypothetical protein
MRLPRLQLAVCLMGCASVGPEVVSEPHLGTIPEEIQIAALEWAIDRFCESSPCRTRLAVNRDAPSDEVLSKVRLRFPEVKPAKKAHQRVTDVGYPYGGSFLFVEGPVTTIGADEVEVTAGIDAGWTGTSGCSLRLVRAPDGTWTGPPTDAAVPCTSS